jgi:hypothetical protein
MTAVSDYILILIVYTDSHLDATELVNCYYVVNSTTRKIVPVMSNATRKPFQKSDKKSLFISFQIVMIRLIIAEAAITAVNHSEVSQPSPS